MERDYWDQFRNIRNNAADYFDTVGKNERELMNNSKNFQTRLRLNRQVEFTEDFRKRFMTREYGNYQKYENNSITENVEKGEDDVGADPFLKNNRDMMRRVKLMENQEEIEQENEGIEDIMKNDQIADQSVKERFSMLKNNFDYTEEALNCENEMKMMRDFDMSEISYHGRMSPVAKEELYQNYQKGMTIKDLSLKYGILPQRVKAIVFQRHLYWNEVYPKLGETHMRLALERELFYA